MATPPNRFIRLLAIMVVGAIAAVLPGCSCDKRTEGNASAPRPPSGGQITAQSEFSPEQFNLGLIVSDLTSGKLSVNDLDTLQAYVNDTSETGPGINGLDADEDNVMDWVQVTSDGPQGNRVVVDFTGCKSGTSQNECDPYYVASVTVEKDASGQYLVTGDYSSAVPGYDAYHYERRAALRDALFFAALYNMTRPRVIMPMGVVGYRPVPVMSRSMMQQRQTSYTTTKKITTVTKKTMPPSVKKSQGTRTAAKTKSQPGRVAGPGKTTAPQKPATLQDATKGQKNFTNNGQSTSTKKGNSLRGTQQPKAPAAQPRAPARQQTAPPRNVTPPRRQTAPPRRQSAPARRPSSRRR